MKYLVHFFCLLAALWTTIQAVPAVICQVCQASLRNEGLKRTPNSAFPCPSGVPQIYLHHPDDCNAFYLCRNGVFQGSFKCPAELWFHSVLQDCVDPEKSDCTVAVTTTTRLPQTDEPPVTLTTNQPPKPTTDSSVETTSNERFLCPPGVPQIYVQHPYDCNAFYLCRSGAFLGTFKCPSERWFSSQIQGCVYPEESDCTVEGTTEQPRTDESPVTDSTSWAPSPTTDSSIETTSADKLSCPANIPVIYVQHPDDCNAFYLCRNGVFLGVFNCPEKLWFSSEGQSCVDPNESDCTIVVTTRQPQTDEPPVTFTSHQPPKPTTDSPIETTPGGALPCPAGVPQIYMQHPDICNAFYLCRNGTFQGSFNCPAGLWFNFQIQGCVPPAESDCTADGTTGQPQTDEPPVTISTSRPPNPTTDSSIETTLADKLSCPANISVVYMQHPDDCNAFYLCRNGVFLGIFNCPEELWFSSELQSCVDPKESDCTVSGTTRQPQTDEPSVTFTTNKPTTDSSAETTPGGALLCPPGIPQIYIQHPDDCNAFYLCRNGVFQGSFACPPGLWFSSQLQGCVNPQESDCIADFV